MRAIIIILAALTGSALGKESLIQCNSSEPNNVTQSTVQPHQFKCSLYIRCDTTSDGGLEPTLQRCKSLMNFDERRGKCALLLVAKCSQSKIRIRLVNFFRAKTDARCQVNTDQTNYIPHETNCNHFYQCTRGKLDFEFGCPIGLHFNAELQVCDWPEHANCTEIEKCKPRPEPTCPSDTLQPHPTSCDTFYQCVWSKPVLMACPAGTHFNTDIRACDWPENAGCTTCDLQ